MRKKTGGRIRAGRRQRSVWLSLHRAAGQARDEVALEEDEHDGDGHGADDAGGHHGAPVGAGLAQEGHHQARSQRALGGIGDQSHGVEQVVPAPYEAVNGDGHHAGRRHGEDDLPHDAEIARAVDLGALDERVGQLIEVRLERLGAHREGKRPRS